ncbi:hypothetical protein H4R20_002130, partial [Coemansia guatemalensis]
DLLSITHPILLSRLIGFVMTYNTPQAEPVENGYFYAIATYAVVSTGTFILQAYFANNQYVLVLVRAGYTTALFKKSMALSNNSRQKHNIGSIVTHMSVDAQRVSSFIAHYSSLMLAVPIRIVLVLYMLYQTLGWSAFAGVLALIISFPVTAHISKKVSSIEKKQMGYRDERIKVMDEVLSGIKIIKLYAWESSFIKRIDKIRNSLELAALRRTGMFGAILQFVSKLSPYIVSIMTFTIYSLADNKSHGPLTSQLVFVTLMLLRMLKLPFEVVSALLPMGINAVVSYRRLRDFMLADEIDFAAIDRVPYDRDSAKASVSDMLVSVKNGTFKWLPADEPALVDINIQCKRNEMVAVIGQVGSGKSSLVSAILGDMVKCTGNVSVHGAVAYVPQQSWIMNATLRDNILFGSRYDEEFYNRVVDACALRQDMDVLPNGDLTEIGEKGINLSGGQKMRVSLARAVYARADVYILDDPLAAVDPHVSKHIFTHVLGPNGMLQSRARILITNAVQYLNYADNICMIQEGRIIEQGAFAQVMESKGDIHEFIHKYIDNKQISESSTSSSSTSVESISYSPKRSIGRADTAVVSRALFQQRLANSQSNSEEEIGRTTTNEVSQKGKVKMNVYRSYIEACGVRNIVLFFTVLVLATIADTGANLWLKHWASENDKAGKMRFVPQNAAEFAFYYLIVYGSLGLLYTLISTVKSLIMWTMCSIQASRKIHDEMLGGVMRSPMSFFDVTPMGRIINRFSSDLEKCDENLPQSASNMANIVTGLIAAAVIIGYTTPLTLVLAIPLTYFYLNIQRRYLSSSRELRRLESTTRSPVIAQFQESINGVSSIRAYGQQSRFLIENEGHLGINIKVNYNYWFVNRWLAMRLDALGNLIVFSTSLLAVMSVHFYGAGDAAMVGLAVTYAFDLIFSINWAVRDYTSMENAMTHLERIIEYTELPSEAANIIDDRRPDDSWPEQGMVEFRNYSTRYRDGLDLVLKDLSFRVLPRQKVGIVGRTGAGKSSLTLALFRIIESAGGQILIDGEDIFKYGLFDVRSKLSIIPQDAVLFAGTVRDNLDPFNQYSDQELWRVLEQAHLADYIRTKDERLEFAVTQNGENFSVGQRQLICLARALLKQAKVLILDEATAAIDNATDEIIQKTIRTEFKNCTVLTIAHRLNTIIDNDMVLVVDGGRLAEYDTPQNLLANKDSLFSKLAVDATSQA